MGRRDRTPVRARVGQVWRDGAEQLWVIMRFNVMQDQAQLAPLSCRGGGPWEVHQDDADPSSWKAVMRSFDGGLDNHTYAAESITAFQEQHDAELSQSPGVGIGHAWAVIYPSGGWGATFAPERHDLAWDRARHLKGILVALPVAADFRERKPVRGDGLSKSWLDQPVNASVPLPFTPGVTEVPPEPPQAPRGQLRVQIVVNPDKPLSPEVQVIDIDADKQLPFELVVSNVGRHDDV